MPKPGYLLFDWGDTLMADDASRTDPMVGWPDVRAITGAGELLAQLHAAGIPCGIASSARVSTEAEIRAALARVGLADYIGAIFCWRNVGAEKRNPQYWHKVAKKLALPVQQLVMVGDQLMSDVRVPAGKGLSAVWFNPQDSRSVTGPGYTTIHALAELPQALAELQFTLSAPAQ